MAPAQEKPEFPVNFVLYQDGKFRRTIRAHRVETDTIAEMELLEAEIAKEPHRT